MSACEPLYSQEDLDAIVKLLYNKSSICYNRSIGTGDPVNKRIQLLATQAWQSTSDEVAHLSRIHNRTITQDEITDIFEVKFAELIVRECIKCSEPLVSHYIDTHAEQEQALLLAAIADYSSEISKHFGVEE